MGLSKPGFHYESRGKPVTTTDRGPREGVRVPSGGRVACIFTAFAPSDSNMETPGWPFGAADGASSGATDGETEAQGKKMTCRRPTRGIYETLTQVSDVTLHAPLGVLLGKARSSSQRHFVLRTNRETPGPFPWVTENLVTSAPHYSPIFPRGTPLSCTPFFLPKVHQIAQTKPRKRTFSFTSCPVTEAAMKSISGPLTVNGLRTFRGTGGGHTEMTLTPLMTTAAMGHSLALHYASAGAAA